MRSLKTSSQESKLIPNSPILGNKHELRGIVVNKGANPQEINIILRDLFEFDQIQGRNMDRN